MPFGFRLVSAISPFAFDDRREDPNDVQRKRNAKSRRSRGTEVYPSGISRRVPECHHPRAICSTVGKIPEYCSPRFIGEGRPARALSLKNGRNARRREGAYNALLCERGHRFSFLVSRLLPASRAVARGPILSEKPSNFRNTVL